MADCKITGESNRNPMPLLQPPRSIAGLNFLRMAEAVRFIVLFCFRFSVFGGHKSLSGQQKLKAAPLCLGIITRRF